MYRTFKTVSGFRQNL